MSKRPKLTTPTQTVTEVPLAIWLQWHGDGEPDDSDEPALEEEIHVYRLASEPITAHVDGRNPTTGKRYGKWMSIADYALHSEQPDDRTARNKAAWQEWCAEQGKRISRHNA